VIGDFVRFMLERYETPAEPGRNGAPAASPVYPPA